MQAFRPLLWRHARRTNRVLPYYVYGALQHNYHGPHKEYFQTPGQMPTPDTTPYTGPYTPPSPPSPTVLPSPGPSLLRRATRSVLWATLFGITGLAAGTALITWEYLQPTFEPGSVEDEELTAEIGDTLESHPLVEALRDEGWVEESYYAGKINGPGRGQHLVAETLTGTRGIMMKTFKHPTLDFTMMVFFLGFGIEGWPDVIHGGIITTLLQEGINHQVRNLYKHYGKQHSQFIAVDFKRPMRPGDIYAVLIPPAQLELQLMPDVFHLQLTAMLLHLETPPRITIEPSEDRTSIELAGRKPNELIHALASAQVRMVQDVTDARMAEIEAKFEEERRLLEEAEHSADE
ncbi:hypothetical protein A1O3_08099 [Capronia epimyces CBS 606.96]|uniref:Thioesterase domain-containing protein n=1 Tax=Capronia epimyces CBS 606.96 TaxID=1182542 RepID=W9YBT4_9EURO|nr:uncharacterized protein A1O3_08099 [Capronia epimyces CBS 606.96]EXJ79814.1 hypothetical protein A1O3_08099 [Capronia epimyces CBS 606.96]